MREAIHTLLLAVPLLAAGCVSSVTQGNTNGGPPHKHTDAGTGTGGLALGAACTSNAACNSQLCGLSGTGNCCAQACPSTNSACAADGCDDGGSCTYVPGATPCGAEVCDGISLTGPACNGFGDCNAKTVQKCPGNFACNDAGTDCNAACASSADCAPGSKCNQGLCAPPVTAGPCTEADDCVSGICGVDGGVGHCCNSHCPAVDPSCAALDCDKLGDCAYPDAGSECEAATCVASAIQSARFCDGAGHCQAPSTQSCSPYACSSAQCEQSCTALGGCALGAYCDQGTSTCCALANGSTLAVDNVLGDDTAQCCGTGNNLACRTLTHAMQIIDAAQARHVIVNAISASMSWSMDAETVPVMLGWGTELFARSTSYFWGPTDGGARAIFEIGRYSANDAVGTASIVGGIIGEDLAGNPSPQPDAILVDPGATGYVANAEIRSSRTYQSTAIEVSAGGTLVLGKDEANTNTNGVAISGASGGGFNGIVCDADAGVGCTIRDNALDFGRSLVIGNQSNVDLDAEDHADIVLLAGSLFGQAVPTTGYGNCVAKFDSAAAGGAVLLHGSATVKLQSAAVQCIAGNGIALTASASGVPSLTLENAVVSNCDCGLHAYAGKATITGTLFQFNYNGVVQDTDGKNVSAVDLYVDGGGINIVACNDAIESSQLTSVPGVAVLNATANPLDAESVEWDTSGPDTFTCAPALTGCSCALATCTLPPGADGMDAVSVSSGSVVTTGNLTTDFTCTPACNGSPCPGGQACCSGSCC